MRKIISLSIGLLFVLLFSVQVYAATVNQGSQTTITPGFNVITDVNVNLNYSIVGNTIIVTGNRPGNHTMTVTGIRADGYQDTFVTIINVIPSESNIEMTAPTQYINMAVGVASYVDVTLRNTTQILASAATISIPPNANFDIVIIDNPSPFTLANAPITVRFRITPRDSVSDSSNIRFDLNYRNAVGDTFTREFFIPALVQTTPDARVSITNFATSPNIVAGQDFTVSATIRNLSTVVANNVQVSLGDLGAGGLLMQGSNVYFVGNLAANAERVVTFNMSSISSTSTGSYPVSIRLTYGDYGDISNQFFITIIGDSEEYQGRLVVTDITRPTGVFAPNQQVPISFTIRNDGEETVNNIHILADSNSGVVPRLASNQTIQNLAVGESATLHFAFAATAQAQSQFHDIGFTVRYDDSEFTQFSGFTVYNPDVDDDDRDDNNNIITPRVIISNYRVDPVIVMANSEFDLYLTIQNTDANRSIGNMRVTWQVHGVTVGTGQGATVAGGATFTPVNASNTFFIENIHPRGEVVHHLRLFTIPDAAAQNHVISITFDYYDMEGNSFQTSEDIGINVRQVSRLELGQANVPEFATVNQFMQQQFNVVNTGRSTLHNLRVRFEGEGFDTSQADEFFGNLQGGNAEFFWGSIIPVQGGDLTLYLIASFEDELGELHEIIQSFNLWVDDPWVNMGSDDDFFFPGGDDIWFDDGFGGDWEEPTEGLQSWHYAVIGVVGTALAFGIAILVIRKKKRGPSFLHDDNFDMGYGQIAATKEPEPKTEKEN